MGFAVKRRGILSRIFRRKRRADDSDAPSRGRKARRQAPGPPPSIGLTADPAEPQSALADVEADSEPWYRQSGPIFSEPFSDRPPPSVLPDGADEDGSGDADAELFGDPGTEGTGNDSFDAADNAQPDESFDAPPSTGPYGRSVPPSVPIIQRLESEPDPETPIEVAAPLKAEEFAVADADTSEPDGRPDTTADDHHLTDSSLDDGLHDDAAPATAADIATAADDGDGAAEGTSAEPDADAGRHVPVAQGGAPQRAQAAQPDGPSIIPIRGYYVARTHDTLRSVAAQFLNAPERWSELRSLNAAYPGVADAGPDTLLAEGTALALPGDPLAWGRPDPVYLWTLAETFLFTAWGREPTPEEVVPFWRGLSAGALPEGAEAPALGPELPGIEAVTPPDAGCRPGCRDTAASIRDAAGSARSSVQGRGCAARSRIRIRRHRP